MITHKQIKFVRSLKQKKNRTDFFVVEGKKLVDELLQSTFEIEHLFHSNKLNYSHQNAVLVGEKDLQRMTHLSSHAEVICVVKKPDFNFKIHPEKRYIALDNIKDPGNLGTIIRLADWFGIEGIICSENTVDVYNSKAIQSAMGSAFRVPLIYSDLTDIFTHYHGAIIGADLDGENLHENQLPKNGILVIGSESHGISDELQAFLTNKTTIPKFGQAESLNAAIACAVICNEWVKI